MTKTHQVLIARPLLRWTCRTLAGIMLMVVKIPGFDLLPWFVFGIYGKRMDWGWWTCILVLLILFAASVHLFGERFTELARTTLTTMESGQELTRSEVALHTYESVRNNALFDPDLDLGI